MPPSRLQVAACLAAACLCLIALPASAVVPNGRLQIIHLDVGQGDGAVIISPLGQVVMIDDGVGGNPTPANGVKVPQQLQALGVTHVDHHFASHYHSDHIGLFSTIFGAGGVATLDYGWDRGGSYTTSYYTNYVNTLGSRRRTLTKGQVITLDSLSAHPVTIKCVDLNAAGKTTTDENSLCVQLKVSYGEFDMAFGGDTPGQNSGSYVNVETTVGPEMGPVEVYKVHHHGSATSSQTDWLAATHPTVAVVSAGTGNSYGHPTAAAMTRLHNAGTHVYWTETGSGATPVPGWDTVSNGQIVISATWEPGGVDTIRGNGFADTFTNSGTSLRNLAIAVVGQGTVSKTPDLAMYPLGTLVEAQASPADGWAFTQWLGDMPGTDNPLSLTVNQDLSLTAVFVDVAPPLVTVSSPNGGESLTAGAQAAIAWSAQDNAAVDSVQVECSLAGSAGPWTVLGHGLPNSGTLDWTVPDQPTDSAYVRVIAYDPAGNAGLDTSDGPFQVVGPDLTAADDGPIALSLARPVPNPARGSTLLRFSLPKAGAARLELVDVSGRRVWSAEGSFPAGTHTWRWQGADAGGGRLRSGIYFVRLVTPWGTRTERLVLFH